MRTTREEIIAWCRRELLCDNVRFVTAGSKIFLIAGWRRSTEQDSGQWYRNGELYDFDYFEEHCIASGRTSEEILESAREYGRLVEMEADGMTAYDLLLERLCSV